MGPEAQPTASARARHQALPDRLLREAIAQGWMTVLQGSVVQVLHAAAKLQARGRIAPLDRADEEAEFDLDDELPTATLASEIPSAAPRVPARFGKTVLGRPVHSYADVADLCVALGLLSEHDDGIWRVHVPLPPPVDVLPLEGEERNFHDQRQWQAQLAPTIRAMIQTFLQAARGLHPQLPFDRGADRRLTCTASVYWWCQRTDAHPEAVRGAALALVDGHEFSASPTPELLYWEEPFSLSVDTVPFERTWGPIEARSHTGPGGTPD